jgi:hypothetical protein
VQVVVDGHAAVDLKAGIGHGDPDAGECRQQAVQPAERRAGVAQRRRARLGRQDRTVAEQVGEGRAGGIAQDANAHRIEPERLAKTEAACVPAIRSNREPRFRLTCSLPNLGSPLALVSAPVRTREHDHDRPMPAPLRERKDRSGNRFDAFGLPRS